MDWKDVVAEASESLRMALERQSVTKNLKRGELVFDQGEHDDRLFVLESGRLEVNVLSYEGKKLALNQLRPQTVFGEIALFDPGRRTARVEALEASVVRSIRRNDVLTEIRQSPDIGIELMRMAGMRMRWLASQVEEQVFLPPTARLAAKILYLMDKDQSVTMAQSSLADFVGVTREVVSKTLAAWRREGIVDVSRGQIRVRDVDALAGLSNYLI